ncbi:MAG: HNH endonuclease, partial [Micrococcales bacterium]|nr:HNH endonuclease [Micrococcales bacterium]
AVVLPGASGLTPRTLGVAVDNALHQVDPDRAVVDQQARAWRRVGSPCPLGQGMASLTAVLAVVDAARVDKTLEQVARAARAAGDPRNLGQLRADIMVDVLTGDARAVAQHDHGLGFAPAGVAEQDQCAGDTAEPGRAFLDADALGSPGYGAAHTGRPGQDVSAHRGQAGPAVHAGTAVTRQDTRTVPNVLAPDDDEPPDDPYDDFHQRSRWRLPPPGTVHVNLTISAASLLGLTNDPGHIAGAGTIDAVTARALAHDGPWRRIVTDPVSGAVLDVGRTRYRPPAALAAHVAARNPHCVCSTCAQPAANCDLDHTTEWRDGGTTNVSNLAPLCRASHTLKTDGHLRLTTTAPGVYRWTTALGIRYQVDTTSGVPRRKRVRMIRDDIPPPF